MENRLTTTSDQYCTTKSKPCDDITVIWLGKSLKDTQGKSIVSLLKEQLKEVQVFDDIDDCVDYMSSLEDDTVFFIVSYTFSETIVSLIHEISSIAAIYIYCETCSA